MASIAPTTIPTMAASGKRVPEGPALQEPQQVMSLNEVVVSIFWQMALLSAVGEVGQDTLAAAFCTQIPHSGYSITNFALLMTRFQILSAVRYGS